MWFFERDFSVNLDEYYGYWGFWMILKVNLVILGKVIDSIFEGIVEKKYYYFR